MLTNRIILAISGRDTLRPLKASSLGPLQKVSVTRNTINDIVLFKGLRRVYYRRPFSFFLFEVGPG